LTKNRCPVEAVFGALLMAIVLSACGGGGSGSSAHSATTLAAGSNVKAGGASQFCQVVSDAISAANPAFRQAGSTPDVIHQEYVAGKAKGQEALSIAPSEIKPDLTLLMDASNQLGDALAKVNYDGTKLPAASTAPFSNPQIQAASTHVSTYVQQHCRSAVGG
jgi:hypothetical protein